MLQIYGTCEACRSGVPARRGKSSAAADRRAVRAGRAAHGGGDRTQRPRVLYARGEDDHPTRAAARCSRSSPTEEQDHFGRLEARYKELLSQYPGIESQPTFLFFKGAANGLFAAGTEELKQGVDDRQALLIGIRCERGSHRFFKKYGERFEESEGKRVFLEFAEEEREHLDLLIREYRSLVARQGKPRRRPA